MRDQEIIGLQEAYLEVYEEVDTRRAPKEMLDRLNASREGHMAQDGANKSAYDAKQRLLKKAHKKRTEISEAQEEGRRARKRYKNAPSYDQVKAGIDAKEKAAAERKAERAAARRPLTPGERYEQEKAARGKKYSSDVNPYFNPRSVREEVLSYLLDEGFASDEKSAEAIMGAMSEAWVESIVEMTDFEAGGGNAKMAKTGMSKDKVIALGQKNLAVLAKKSPSSAPSNDSNSSNSGGGVKPGDYNININFVPKKEPNQQPAAYTPPRSLTRKPYGPATAKSIFQKPDYDVPSFADMKDDQMRSQAQDADEWLVKAGKQKPGYKGTQNIANKTIAKQRAYYGQK